MTKPYTTRRNSALASILLKRVLPIHQHPSRGDGRNPIAYMTEAQIAAIAGEHFVAHKIAMLGFLPTLIRQRHPRVDVLVSTPKGDRTVTLQIKSTFNAVREPSAGAPTGDTIQLRFPLGHRAIAACTPSTCFCFVDLRRPDAAALPDVYVVPGSVLLREHEGTLRQRYSQLHYQRPWLALQPYRNNWTPVLEALTATDKSASPRSDPPPTTFDGLAQRWRTGLRLMNPELWTVRQS